MLLSTCCSLTGKLDYLKRRLLNEPALNEDLFRVFEKKANDAEVGDDVGPGDVLKHD